jgi:hypothetical protein
VPVSQWHQIQAFDTAAQCEEQRASFQEVARDSVSRHQHELRLIHLKDFITKAQAEKSRCVAGTALYADSCSVFAGE